MSNNYIYPGLNQAGQINAAVQPGKKVSTDAVGEDASAEPVAPQALGTSTDLLASLNFIAGQNKIAMQTMATTNNDAEIASLQDKIQTAQGQVELYSTQNTKLRTNINTLKAALKKKKLVKKGKKKVEVYAYSTSKRKDMAERIKTYQKQLNARKDKIESLNQKMETWQAQLDVLQPPSESNTPDTPVDNTPDTPTTPGDTPPVEETPDDPGVENPPNLPEVGGGDADEPVDNEADGDWPDFSLDDLIKNLPANDPLNSTTDSADKAVSIPYLDELLSALNSTALRSSPEAAEVLTNLARSFDISPSYVTNTLSAITTAVYKQTNSEYLANASLANIYSWSANVWSALQSVAPDIYGALTEGMGLVAKKIMDKTLTPQIQDTLVNQFGVSADTINGLIQQYGADPSKWSEDFWNTLDSTMPGLRPLLSLVGFNQPVVDVKYVAASSVYMNVTLANIDSVMKNSSLYTSPFNSLGVDNSDAAKKQREALAAAMAEWFNLPSDILVQADYDSKLNQQTLVDISKTQSAFGAYSQEMYNKYYTGWGGFTPDMITNSQERQHYVELQDAMSAAYARNNQQAKDAQAAQGKLQAAWILLSAYANTIYRPGAMLSSFPLTNGYSTLSGVNIQMQTGLLSSSAVRCYFANIYGSDDIRDWGLTVPGASQSAGVMSQGIAPDKIMDAYLGSSLAEKDLPPLWVSDKPWPLIAMTLAPTGNSTADAARSSVKATDALYNIENIDKMFQLLGLADADLTMKPTGQFGGALPSSYESSPELVTNYALSTAAASLVQNTMGAKYYGATTGYNAATQIPAFFLKSDDVTNNRDFAKKMTDNFISLQQNNADDIVKLGQGEKIPLNNYLAAGAYLELQDTDYADDEMVAILEGKTKGPVNKLITEMGVTGIIGATAPRQVFANIRDFDIILSDVGPSFFSNATIGEAYKAKLQGSVFEENVGIKDPTSADLSSAILTDRLLLVGNADSVKLDGLNKDAHVPDGTLMLDGKMDNMSATGMKVNIVTVSYKTSLVNANFSNSEIETLNLSTNTLVGQDDMNNLAGVTNANGFTLPKNRFDGLNLSGTTIQYAMLDDADLSTANLSNITIRGGTYTSSTKFPAGFDPKDPQYNLQFVPRTTDTFETLMANVPQQTQLQMVADMLKETGFLPNPSYTSNGTEQPFISAAAYFDKREASLEQSVNQEFDSLSTWYDPAKEADFYGMKWKCIDAATQKVFGGPASLIIDRAAYDKDHTVQIKADALGVDRDPQTWAQFQSALQEALQTYLPGQDLSLADQAWSSVYNQRYSDALSMCQKAFANQGITFNPAYIDINNVIDLRWKVSDTEYEQALMQNQKFQDALALLSPPKSDYMNSLFTIQWKQQKADKLAAVEREAEKGMTDAEYYSGIFYVALSNYSGRIQDTAQQWMNDELNPTAQGASPASMFLGNGAVSQQLSDLWSGVSGLGTKVFQDMIQDQLSDFKQQLNFANTQLIEIYQKRTNNTGFQDVTRKIDDMRFGVLESLNSNIDNFQQSMGHPFTGYGSNALGYQLLSVQNYINLEPSPGVSSEDKFLTKIAKSIAEYQNMPYNGNIAEDVGVGMANQLASIPEAVWDNPVAAAAVLGGVAVAAAIHAPITLVALVGVGLTLSAVQGVSASKDLVMGYMNNNHAQIQQGWQGVGATTVDLAMTYALDAADISDALKVLQSWGKMARMPGATLKTTAWNVLANRNIESLQRINTTGPAAKWFKEQFASGLGNVPLGNQLPQPTGLVDVAQAWQATIRAFDPAGQGLAQAHELANTGKLTGPFAADMPIPSYPKQDFLEGYQNIGHPGDEIYNEIGSYEMPFMTISANGPLVSQALQSAAGIPQTIAKKIQAGELPSNVGLGLPEEDALVLHEMAALVNSVKDGTNGLLGNYNLDAFKGSPANQIGGDKLMIGIPATMDDALANGTGICRQTAFMVAEMAEKANIQVTLRCGGRPIGYGPNEPPHMWIEFTLPSGAQCIVETTDGNILVNNGGNVGVFNSQGTTGPRRTEINPMSQNALFNKNFINRYYDINGEPLYPWSGAWW